MSDEQKSPGGVPVDLSALIQAEVQRALGGQQRNATAGSSVVVAELLDLHAKTKLLKRAKGTQATYHSRFRPLSRHMGTVPVMELTHDHFDDYICKREADGVMRSTATMELQALVTAIRTAVKRHRIPYNPMGEYEWEPQTGFRDRVYFDREI